MNYFPKDPLTPANLCPNLCLGRVHFQHQILLLRCSLAHYLFIILWLPGDLIQFTTLIPMLL